MMVTTGERGNRSSGIVLVFVLFHFGGVVDANELHCIAELAANQFDHVGLRDVG